MDNTVTVLPNADELVREAHAFWSANHPSKPDLLLREFIDSLELLKRFPLAGSRHPCAARPCVRRLLLRRTQHWVYYRFLAGEPAVFVLSVWSTARGREPFLPDLA